MRRGPSTLVPPSREPAGAGFNVFACGDPVIVTVALAMAALVDRIDRVQASSATNAVGPAEDALQLAADMVRTATQGAPPDSIAPAAATIVRCLPEGHPVAREIVSIASANASAEFKRFVEARLRAAKRRAADRAAEDVFNDRRTSVAGRVLADQAATPIPERVWAMRNVASTLASGGQLGQARKMMEEAVELMEQYLGSDDHPGLLMDLSSLASVYDRGSLLEWQELARRTRRRIVHIVVLVANTWAEAGRRGEAADLLEGLVREYESLFTTEDVSLIAARQRLQTLSQEDPTRKAGKPRMGVVKQLAKEFEQEIRVRLEAKLQRRSTDDEEFGNTG
ncbi:unnamed protein product [Pedinophyceae sp. YPF-701]|nr:unnamed protein product [Pedinophyceae sp. YPF-701]